MSKTGGGPGTNQYAVRGVAAPAPVAWSPIQLMPVHDPNLASYACSFIWGGDCEVPVQAPNWSHDHHPEIRDIEDARFSHLPLQLQLSLARHPNSAIRVVLARDNETPEPVRLALMDDAEESVRRHLAESDTGSPPSVLARLAEDAHRSVRAAVAANPNTPPSTLLRMCEIGRSGGEALALIQNPNLPVEGMFTLLRRGEWARYHLAMSHSTPPEVLLILATYRDGLVRRTLAQNPNTPPEVLWSMESDPDSFVRMEVLKNPNTPLGALESGSLDDDEASLYALSQNPSLPAAILDKLMNTGSLSVRESVVSHPNTSSETLLNTAMGDPDEDMRRAAYERLPEHIRAIVVLGDSVP